MVQLIHQPVALNPTAQNRKIDAGRRGWRDNGHSRHSSILGILKSDKLSSNRAEQDRFLDRTREAWQRHSPHPLTREDAQRLRRTASDFSDFFRNGKPKRRKKIPLDKFLYICYIYNIIILRGKMKKKSEDKKTDRMIHIRLSEDVHRKVRIRAAELDTTVQKFVEAAIKNELERQAK